MFDEKLLTKKDLAERWQVSPQTVDNYIADKIIIPIKGIPSIRFNPQYISELEGVKLEKFSPIERRRLEREIEDLKQENKLLKEIGLNLLSESARLASIIK